MSGVHFETVLRNADHTAELARQVAQQLEPGDTILLSGGIGAGKTHFARSAIASLLIEPEDIPSPTFTLVQVYDSQKGEIWHSDLYRLSDTAQIEELGLVDAMQDCICLIEWPERLGQLAPTGALHLAFSLPENPDERSLTASSPAMRWAHVFDGQRVD